jgi:predicted enzyme related to lactoylglutathione lyase
LGGNVAVRLDHVGIVSPGPEQNRDVAEFFQAVLGCAVDGDPLAGYAEVKIGGTIVALHSGARAEVGKHGGTLLQLTTDSVDEEVAVIRARGGVIAAEPEDLPPWGRSAYLAGPEGVMVEIYQP